VSEKDLASVALVAASIPGKLRWLDTEGVGAMLGYSTAQVRDRLSQREDFPKPARIDGGHPRWKASEIDEWMERQRAKAA